MTSASSRLTASLISFTTLAIFVNTDSSGISTVSSIILPAFPASRDLEKEPPRTVATAGRVCNTTSFKMFPPYTGQVNTYCSPSATIFMTSTAQPASNFCASSGVTSLPSCVAAASTRDGVYFSTSFASIAARTSGLLSAVFTVTA